MDEGGELESGGRTASWGCLRDTFEGELKAGDGTLAGATTLLGKTCGKPVSELFFNNNPLLTDFGDVLGDFSTPRLLLAAIDSNFETKAWLSSSGEGEGEP